MLRPRPGARFFRTTLWARPVRGGDEAESPGGHGAYAEGNLLYRARRLTTASVPWSEGYDPKLFWRGGVSDPTFGVLTISPSRIQLRTGAEMMQVKPPRLCRL